MGPSQGAVQETEAQGHQQQGQSGGTSRGGARVLTLAGAGADHVVLHRPLTATLAQLIRAHDQHILQTAKEGQMPIELQVMSRVLLACRSSGSHAPCAKEGQMLRVTGSIKSTKRSSGSRVPCAKGQMLIKYR